MHRHVDLAIEQRPLDLAREEAFPARFAVDDFSSVSAVLVTARGDDLDCDVDRRRS
jgi:hypothetical protein